MSIDQLLQNSGMKPEKIGRIKAAYALVLAMLCLKDHNDPLTEMVAKKIIKIAESGILEPAEIAARVMRELGGW